MDEVGKFRRALEAFNRGDLEAAMQDMDPEVEWFPPEPLPDKQVYRGYAAVRAWWATLNDVFTDFRIEPGEFRDLGDGVVLVPVRAFGRGKESGAPVESSFCMMGTGHDLLKRMEFFPGEEEALAAVKERRS
jgi:ketosteroid isomerase-like protein